MEQLGRTALVAVVPTPVGAANELLTEWRHVLGPCRRPFRQECYALLVEERPVSVAVSASVVGTPVAGYRRNQVVELARLCSAPDAPWATRVMLRLWRMVCAPRWACWPVCAAVSYSHTSYHRGDVYRFDGWERVKDGCGGAGGGTWSKRRDADHPANGAKTLWVWRYDPPPPDL